MKYLNKQGIDLGELKHDILGLVGPLAYSKELNESGDSDLAEKIHQQAIAKIEGIAKELELIEQKLSQENTHEISK